MAPFTPLSSGTFTLFEGTLGPFRTMANRSFREEIMGGKKKGERRMSLKSSREMNIVSCNLACLHSLSQLGLLFKWGMKEFHTTLTFWELHASFYQMNELIFGLGAVWVLLEWICQMVPKTPVYPVLFPTRENGWKDQTPAVGQLLFIYFFSLLFLLAEPSY